MRTFQRRALDGVREERRSRIRFAVKMAAFLLSVILILTWGFHTPDRGKRPKYVYFQWRDYPLNSELDTL